MQRVQQEMNRINSACDLVYYQQPALFQCLISFFRNAYVAELTEDDTSCFWKHSILDNIPARDYEEFINRQDCFINLKIFKDSCNWEAQEYVSIYPESYKRFARYMTTRVTNEICTDPRSLLNTARL